MWCSAWVNFIHINLEVRSLKLLIIVFSRLSVLFLTLYFISWESKVNTFCFNAFIFCAYEEGLLSYLKKIKNRWYHSCCFQMHFLNRLLGIEAYWQKANPIPSLLPLLSFSSCASVAGMVTQVHSARECYDGSVAREYGLHGAAASWLPAQGVELIVLQFPWERISQANNWEKVGCFIIS